MHFVLVDKLNVMARAPKNSGDSNKIIMPHALVKFFIAAIIQGVPQKSLFFNF